MTRAPPAGGRARFPAGLCSGADGHPRSRQPALVEAIFSTARPRGSRSYWSWTSKLPKRWTSAVWPGSSRLVASIVRQDRRAGDAVAGAEPGAIVDRGVGPAGSQRDRLMPRQRCRRCVWRSSSGATTWRASSSLPRRWVVERPFSWFGRNRRLDKDFENLTETLATFVTLASIQLALRRLARA